MINRAKILIGGNVGQTSRPLDWVQAAFHQLGKLQLFSTSITASSFSKNQFQKLFTKTFTNRGGEKKRTAAAQRRERNQNQRKNAFEKRLCRFGTGDGCSSSLFSVNSIIDGGLESLPSSALILRLVFVISIVTLPR